MQVLLKNPFIQVIIFVLQPFTHSLRIQFNEQIETRSDSENQQQSSSFYANGSDRMWDEHFV